MRDSSSVAIESEPAWLGYVKLARIDHWTKNVFVLPGVLVPLTLAPNQIGNFQVSLLLLGLFSTCLVTSSNYVLNEILDLASDRFHPVKKHRPLPSGRISTRWAYVEWLALGAVGIYLSSLISVSFMGVMLALWIMGIVYNVPPLRSKDVPYLDVLTEAFNNPLRMLAGWYLSGTTLTPITSLLISYWMVGCFFMAAKRFAEYNEIGDATRAAAYRKSFATYNAPRLLVSIMFYASNAMLFFGAFIVRYRIELVLAFPFVALTMATYLRMSFQKNSPAQAPEHLYRERYLMATVIVCTIVMILLLAIDVPIVSQLFTPSIT